VLLTAPRHYLTTLAALAALTLAAHAAERVSLQNGFDLRCDHHATVNGNTRLFLSVGEDNYIDLAPEKIAAFESVPDLPPDPPAAKASTAPQAPSTTAAQNARVPQVSPLKPGNQSPQALNPADLAEMLSRAGADHNLDVDLIASLVKAESNGNARAVSRAGAAGLMQLMPATASDLGVQDRFEPGQNVRGGSTYLDALLTRYHDNLALALAAYNAGPAAVDKYHGIPPYNETRAYVARVIHEFNRRVLAREALARQAQARLALQHPAALPIPGPAPTR
jgi:soluble lytic murein transglycosylase-like protein